MSRPDEAEDDEPTEGGVAGQHPSTPGGCENRHLGLALLRAEGAPGPALFFLPGMIGVASFAFRVGVPILTVLDFDPASPRHPSS